ncbi:hypothetical protein LCGC14_2964180, partial [marine sediment metagenome]
MIEYLEEALDFYLGEIYGVTLSKEQSRKEPRETNSKPELKMWR